MSQSADYDAGPAVEDYPCPACGAPAGKPCRVRLSGVDTTGWAHDARIMAPVYEDLRTRPIPPGSDQPS